MNLSDENGLIRMLVRVVSLLLQKAARSYLGLTWARLCWLTLCNYNNSHDTTVPRPRCLVALPNWFTGTRLVKHHHANPEIKIPLWKPPCRCLGARNFDDCASKQTDVHIPPSMQIHAADDHVRKMPGLVVAVVGGGGAGGQTMAKANEGMKVVGCEGASR